MKYKTCPECEANFPVKDASESLPPHRAFKGTGRCPGAGKLVRCDGWMRNGPEKRYARCTVCGAIDWELNEGDKCRAMVPEKAK